MKTFKHESGHSFILIFILQRETCGILVPQPGNEPVPLHWKHSLNYWTTKGVSLSSSWLSGLNLNSLEWHTLSLLKTSSYLLLQWVNRFAVFILNIYTLPIFFLHTGNTLIPFLVSVLLRLSYISLYTHTSQGGIFFLFFQQIFSQSFYVKII